MHLREIKLLPNSNNEARWRRALSKEEYQVLFFASTRFSKVQHKQECLLSWFIFFFFVGILKTQVQPESTGALPPTPPPFQKSVSKYMIKQLNGGKW